MSKWIWAGIGAVALILILFIGVPAYRKRKQEKADEDAFTTISGQVQQNNSNPTALDWVTQVNSLFGNITNLVSASGSSSKGNGKGGSNELALAQQYQQNLG